MLSRRLREEGSGEKPDGVKPKKRKRITSMKMSPKIAKKNFFCFWSSVYPEAFSTLRKHIKLKVKFTIVCRVLFFNVCSLLSRESQHVQAQESTTRAQIKAKQQRRKKTKSILFLSAQRKAILKLYDTNTTKLLLLVL